MTTEDGALNLYREVFKRMLSVGDTRLIHNDSKNHACVLIAELLKSAEHTILIYCNRLGSDVWGKKEVLESLEYALEHNRSLDVLLQTEPEDPAHNAAYQLLLKHQVVVLKVSSAAVAENFIVIDERAYRLEQDTGCRSGFACANDPTNARILINAFYDLKSSAVAISPKKTEG